MAKIQIDGIGVVQVDDSFLQLSPEQQQQAVDRIKGEASPSVPSGGLLSNQQKQVDALIERGIPEEEAIKAVGQKSPFMSDNPTSQAFDSIPEVDELERLFAGMTEEEKAAYTSNVGAAGAATASFLNSVLPFPALTGAIGIFNPEAADEIKRYIAANPGAADAADWAGTVVGLIGGPAAVARIARGGVNIAKKISTKWAGHVSARGLDAAREEMTPLIDEIKEFTSKNTLKGADKEIAEQLLKNLESEKDEVTDLLNDWGRHIYEQKWTTDEIRNFLENRVNNLPENHIIKKVSGGKADLFDNILERQPAGVEAPKNFGDRIWKSLVHRAGEIQKNAIVEGVEFGAAVSGDAAANYTYAFNDFKEQGFSTKEADVMAMAYARSRTPTDLGVEFFNQLIGGNKGAEIVAALTRLSTLLPTLDPNTGQVNPNKLSGFEDAEPAMKNQGGLLSMKDVKSNMGKKQMMPKKVRGGLLGQMGKPQYYANGSEVNTNVVEKGARNRAALGDFFSKTFDSEQGIHPDVKGTLRSVAELTPILGDALAAEEIARELGKDPINWALVGALGGATLIGVIPGIGDVAASAIKAGARKGLSAVKGGAEVLSRLEVDTDAVGALGGNIRLKPKGSGRKKAIETIYVQDPNTGAVQEMTGTREQLAKKLGKSESALKKARGRDAMGFQWSKDPEGFKEFKSGKAKVKEDRLDADNIDFTRDKRTALPRSLDPEDRDMLEDLVDRELQTSMENHWKFLVDESPWGENDPKISRYFDSVENAEAIAEKAWPGILMKLKNSNWIQGQDNETYNKIIKWAKNRTRQVFDKVEDTDPTGSRARKLFREAEDDRQAMMDAGQGDPGPVTAIDASSLETVTIPGVERRNVMRDRGQRWSDVEKLTSDAKMERYGLQDIIKQAEEEGGLPSDYFNRGGLLKKGKKPKSKKVRGGLLWRRA